MAIDALQLGRTIAEIRKARGMTQGALAEQLGLTTNYLSLVENGQRMLSADAMNRLEGVAGIPAECIVLLGSRTDGAGPLGRRFARLTELTKKAIRDAAGIGTGPRKA